MSMTTTGAYSGDRSQFSTTIAASGVADETIPGLGPVNDLMDNELITVGRDTYVRGGVFGILGGEQNPGETGWLRIPGPAIDASELQMVSPDQLSELLDGAFGDVTDLGAADVRGAATTRYQVALDIDRILGAEVTMMAPGDLSASGNLTIDVYVDAEGVARRVTFAPTLEGTTFEVAADYFDLGAEIDIQPPTDFAELDAETLFGGLGKVLDDAFQDLNSAD